jgi:serine/threonine-protein kinase
MVGTLVAGRFQVLQLLGGGAVGSVYLAEHEALNRQYAIKVLNEMAEVDNAVERFRREAMAAGRLDHPNIVSISYFGQMDDGRFYLVMEYVPGVSMGEALATLGPEPMPLPRALRILDQIAAGLSAAHDAGMIHRDIKPDNVLLKETMGGEEQVKMLDLGLAKLLQDCEQVAPTPQGDIFGTPAYMSPEQTVGEPVDFRSDVYSYGVVAFELLTGQVPFVEENITELLFAHQRQPAPHLRETRPSDAPPLPPSLEAFVMQCLEKDRDQRPARLSEACRIIGKCLDEIDEPQPVSGAGRLPTPTLTGITVDPRIALDAGADAPVQAEPQEDEQEREELWSRLCKKAQDLARMLQRRDLSSPTLDQLAQQMEELEDQVISLEMDLVVYSSQIDDLDAEYRDRETEKRHAILNLSGELFQLENEDNPEPTILADLADQIGGLESRLGEIYFEKDERQQDSSADKEQAQAKLLEVGKHHAACTKRLLLAFRNFQPEQVPSDVRQVYHSIAKLLAQLYRGT